MKVLVTGANGFIGKNLVLRLREKSGTEVLTYVRGQDDSALRDALGQCDAVVHLAGENRPADLQAFADVNTGLTERVCNGLRALGKPIPLILASSAQAELDNPYGRSKLGAEQVVQALTNNHGNPVAIYRLPGVFGKWCKPNYNSVVATFCFNVARDLPIQINDPDASLRLVYVDDVVNAFLTALESLSPDFKQATVEPNYTITLGNLGAQIRAFADCRTNLMSERVGTGLVRALYATYLSYLPIEKFSYVVQQHSDSRGMFVEMLKTPDCGQFSYFTAYPGNTRGGHYHHTKTEKFLVIKGEALFRFRHLFTDELVELRTSGTSPQVVDTIPGWSHDITNVGDDEMVVMLWANEVFNRLSPDTYSFRT
jgi:UDP-2-acetamido-2,6-beta-L-arabino-hexul-4-ose reductase